MLLLQLLHVLQQQQQLLLSTRIDRGCAAFLGSLAVQELRRLQSIFYSLTQG